MPGNEKSDVRKRTPRGRRWIIVIALAALAAGALVAVVWPRSARPTDSGVSGLVLLGPLTPVEQVGGPPNERPYDAVLRVVRAGCDDTVATVRSGADGRFRVDIAPGDYTLVPKSRGDSMLPYASPVDVTVVAHGSTAVTISFDTGIR